MTSDEFRRAGHAMVDWIAAYLERVETLPVLSRVKPGDVRSALPSEPPAKREPFERWLEDIDRVVMPGLTHWQSPNFFAYFPANASGPSILGDLLSAGLGVQGMLWATSPACTEVETHVLDWLVGMLGLPDRFRSTSHGGGVIQDTASSSTLCALLVARERATGGASNDDGLAACNARLVAYASTQTHSSLAKAMKIAGLGERNLRLIDVDQAYAMRADRLREAIARDRTAGLTPFFVCATIGTTSSNAIDPVRAIGEICNAEKLWLHVDAAMSGTAALCPEFRPIHDGVELADSYCFNPHKWMFVNFDCDVFYVADRAALIRTLTVLPEYLRNAATASGAVFDYRDWHVPLGRRFRALKLWFVIRHYGVEGLQALVRHHVALAAAFESWVRADDRFEIVAPRPLNLVSFRLRGSNEENEALLARVNASGEAYLSHTKLGDRYVLRMSIGQTRVEERHVKAAWTLIQRCASRA
ncbi:MAG: aspartate aminotransferase family protein [Phycisphaerae bacterium]|nr:aspartate aminotransferase family protein [Phycisphaerae bacterium]